MPPLDRCHAIVLAAGRGTRMGGPKALMDVGGIGWWRFQNARLTELGVPATWVVSDEVRAALTGHVEAPPRLISSDSSTPMFVSIFAGLTSLAETTPEGVFVLPVDTPAPAAAVWKALAEAGDAGRPAYGGKHGHPVYVSWTVLGPLIEAHSKMSATELASVRLDKLIAPVAREVEVQDPTVTLNLNTPEDVCQFLASCQPPPP